MSRRLLAAAAVLLAAAPARAQAPWDRTAPELRALVARLDSQLAVLDARRARADSVTAPRRAAQTVVAGDITLILWSAVPAPAALVLARRTDSILSSIDVVPRPFLRGSVFVMRGTGDTAAILAAPEFAAHRRIGINVPIGPRVEDPDDWWVLDPLLTTYASSLDSSWAVWTQNAWGFVRWPRPEAAERGARELMSPQFVAVDRCLAGDATGCRKFLGLDHDARPYQTRYVPAELRRAVQGYGSAYPGALACQSGDDAACMTFLERYPFVGLGRIPASGDTRAGVLAAVVALHGAEVLQRALLDREGSIGERLARASGVSVDSLALEWRAWALSGGRPYRVRAGFGDLAAALAAVSLLVFLATRSGRCN